jgi:hypothetical protein
MFYAYMRMFEFFNGVMLHENGNATRFAMQYDSTCRDAKCWVECQVEARGSAREMITIFWTLARLLEMQNAKNFVGK